jgi:hypothetical protein
MDFSANLTITRCYFQLAPNKIVQQQHNISVHQEMAQIIFIFALILENTTLGSDP